MPMTSPERIQFLKDNGFIALRQRGSHLFLKNNETGRATSVLIHNKDLGNGIEAAILKQAGLTKKGQ